MSKDYKYKTAMLNIFIDCMGDGFSDVVLEYENVSDRQNYFRQLRFQMKNGNEQVYNKIKHLLNNTLRGFVNGNLDDENARFCHENASDKYDNLYWGLGLPPEPYEEFFSENIEDVIAYLVADWILPHCSNYKAVSAELIIQNSCFDEKKAEDKESIIWMKQAFRSEYDSALYDVLAHLGTNKTFFKWVIDSFYNDVSDANKANAIILRVFGIGESNKNLTTTFEKLKYEPGKHNWATFNKLFQNELHDDGLMNLLNEEFLLKAYQVFQSRMMMAYIFENLRTVLPKYTGEENSKKVWGILFQAVKDKDLKIDLKAEFLSADYKKL